MVQFELSAGAILGTGILWHKDNSDHYANNQTNNNTDINTNYQTNNNTNHGSHYCRAAADLRRRAYHSHKDKL
jgi:hypothetical protein